MRNLLLILLVIITECVNSQDSSSNQIDTEEFSSFYSKFYSDITFQNERILRPLKGKIIEWDDDLVKEETWENKKITITSKDIFQRVYKNLKSDISVKDSVAIEKYWMEQSGFLVEKSYILKCGKWYLYCYNISNL